MAKRNNGTSSSGRRSSRTNSSAGSSSRQGKSSGKSYKKSGSSPERRSSGSSFKKTGSSARPYKKSAGYSRGGDQDSKRSFRRKEDETERPPRSSAGKKFSDGPRKRTGGNREESERDPRKRFQRKDEGSAPARGDKRYTDRPSPRKKSFDKNEKSDSRNSGAEDRKDRSKRSDSYGLPFKRTYPKKSRESSSESRGRETHKFFNKEKSSYQGKRRGKETESAPVQSDKIRLNRFIANSGVCSRREADELIAMGLITVNGKTITEMGHKVNPGDEVRYESKVLKAEKPVYILLNKPKGYLTTTDDPQERNTVMHIIGSAVKERIYPVGRLDRNTTGLLLLTNDGDLADKLMHPSYNMKKIYKVELDKPLTKADFQKVKDGVTLEEGRAMVDDIAIVSEDNKTVGVEIHIGWNRVVRRIFESLGYEVVRLDRSVYAGLDKKDLGRGEWRHLKRDEIVRLKHFK